MDCFARLAMTAKELPDPLRHFPVMARSPCDETIQARKRGALAALWQRMKVGVEIVRFFDGRYRKT
jgi:hypothetical protein